MNIKLHLDDAESDPIERTAEAFGCDVEDVIYAAVNQYMLSIGHFDGGMAPEQLKAKSEFAGMRAAVLNTKLARKDNLPLWADSAGSVHNYEGFGPDYAAKSKGSIF